MITTWNVNFRRKYLYSMGEKYSKFRGKGIVSVDGDTIVVKGKRIYSGIIILTSVVLFVVLTLVTIFQITLWLLFIVLLVYFLLQDVLLKKEDLTLTWSQIDKFEVVDREELISLSIENNPKYSPIVFSTKNYAEVAATFRERIRDRERTSRGWSAVEQRYDEQMNSMSKSVDRWLKGKRR